MKIAVVCDEKSIMKNKVFRSLIEKEIDCVTVGFEQATLTDNISYNLLDCKQIHLLLHDNLKNEHFLNSQLSMAMFFIA